MKIDETMLFSHPVLTGVSQDYIESEFDGQFDIALSNRNITVSATTLLKCQDLSALIEKGSAGMGYFISCRRTFFNRLIEMPASTDVKKLNADDLYGTLDIRPVVWSKKTEWGWESNNLHPEYNGKSNLPESSILAFGRVHRFSVDRARLKPFETIFLLSADAEIEKGRIQVDPDGPKVTIRAHPETKASIQAIRGPAYGKTVLLNAIYLPAVMELLSQMQQADVSYQDRPWFRVFEAKCVAAGVDYAKDSPLEAAQSLLRLPFKRIDEAKNRLFQ